MAGEKYIDLAVASLLSYYESNLQTYLTAVETAQSLDTGSLKPPIDYVPAFLPDDPRNPLFHAFGMSGGPHPDRDNIYTYNCSVVIGYASDADIEAGQRQMRRYMTALVDCLRADHRLGGTVVCAYDGEQSLDAYKPGDAQTRYAVALDIEVVVQER